MQAIETIHNTSRWGAEVVYGDTDSLFVHLPGKSKEDAFRIGQEIVDIVTDQNPRPIKLKFEKVRYGPRICPQADPGSGVPPERTPREKALRRIQVRAPQRPRARV